MFVPDTLNLGKLHNDDNNYDGSQGISTIETLLLLAYVTEQDLLRMKGPFLKSPIAAWQ